MWKRTGVFLAAAACIVNAFDINAKDNVVVYWGQQGGSLATVCADPSVDVVALAFLTTFFGTGGLPEVDFAGSCSGPTFPGTGLLQCTQIGADIQKCQDAGKIVLLSLGGAIGSYGFSSASEAQNFATTLWNVFGGGSSSTRPFGTSIVDGFDLDIENQEPAYYSNFITALRSLYSGGSKSYYITGAPQCVYPDASLGAALSSSPFDMVFVQFYNNPPCGVEGSGFNYATWQSWASSSANPHVKVFVGVPASASSAGSGYIASDALATVIDGVASQANFGGVMMWDANRAFANVDANGVHYAQNAKNALVKAVGGSTSSSSSGTSASKKSTSQGTVVAAAADAGIQALTTQSPTAVPTTMETVRQSIAGVGTAPALGLDKGRVVTTVAAASTTDDMGAFTTQTIEVSAVTVAVTISATSTSTPEVHSSSSSTSSLSCTIGSIDCVNGQFAQCVDGTYVLTSCPSGTTCKKIPLSNNDVVVTCDYIFSPKRRNVRRHGLHARKHVLVGAEGRGSL